jgi:hypothetical protein
MDGWAVTDTEKASKPCNAQAWREVIVEGFFKDTTYCNPIVTCTLNAGHPDKHAGWCTFITGGGTVQAKVVW